MAALLTVIINVVGDFLVRVFFAALEKTPEWLADTIFDRLSRRKKRLAESGTVLIDPSCGNSGIDLQQQRLTLSAAFGSYFSGLLERDQSYVEIKNQIRVAGSQTSALDPFQAIYWSLNNASGPDVLLIAGEGGMGKSTLAAKIVRCLYSQKAVDMILGDSAKKQEIDPVTGTTRQHDRTSYDFDTFLKGICAQLGLRYDPARSNHQQTLTRIKNRLEGRHAVIVLDNLETVENGATLLDGLRRLTNRGIRIIVTTRDVSKFTSRTPGVLWIEMKPIQHEEQAREFLSWHLHTYAQSLRRPADLEADLRDRGKIKLLLSRTGGIPLLMQLVLSDVDRSSWTRMQQMPEIFGKELLNYLYQERWQEFEQMGLPGKDAQVLLFYIRRQMFRGRVSEKDLQKWAREVRHLPSLEPPMRLLEERFLVVNSDRKHGNYSLFPSLVEFLDDQRAVEP